MVSRDVVEQIYNDLTNLTKSLKYKFKLSDEKPTLDLSSYYFEDWSLLSKSLNVHPQDVPVEFINFKIAFRSFVIQALNKKELSDLTLFHPIEELLKFPEIWKAHATQRIAKLPNECANPLPSLQKNEGSIHLTVNKGTPSAIETQQKKDQPTNWEMLGFGLTLPVMVGTAGLMYLVAISVTEKKKVDKFYGNCFARLFQSNKEEASSNSNQVRRSYGSIQ